MIRFFFPFYKERHEFLVQKWWFRSIFLIYAIWLLISPFYLGLSYLTSQTDWCYAGAQLNASLSSDFKMFRQEIEACQVIAREMWLPSIAVGVIGAPLLHYFLQFLFFVILMDFIVLGTRFKPKNNQT